MASSTSGQDEPNHVMWLATRGGKMEPSCPLGTTRCFPHEKFPRNHIINPLMTKFVWSRWLDIGLVPFFASFWTSTSSWSINTQKKDLANIQPSWPHTWSITNTYCYWAFKVVLWSKYYILPLDILHVGVSHRFPCKNKNAVYHLQISTS